MPEVPAGPARAGPARPALLCERFAHRSCCVDGVQFTQTGTETDYDGKVADDMHTRFEVTMNNLTKNNYADRHVRVLEPEAILMKNVENSRPFQRISANH